MRGSSRGHALRIFRAALRAADPVRAVLAHVRREGETLIAGKLRYDLSSFRNIYVVGAGKASARMAVAIERLLGRRITVGLINAPHAVKLRHVEINEAGHPIPDRRGVAGAKRIAKIASDAGAEDLIVCLISGGASALLPLPARGITLAQKQKITRSLLHCGATIHEINCVRKHLSAIKGGKLARMAEPASLLTLVLSDVIGDDLGAIGSGPTYPDHTTLADARAICAKYAIDVEFPQAAEPSNKLIGWPVIVGSNALAVEAAAEEAKRLGYNTMILSTYMEGEAREVGRVYAAIASEVYVRDRPIAKPACIISGGETTVTIRGKGLGGRNQELALAAAMDIAGWWTDDVVILSAGTDGIDGPTDAAGAIAQCSSVHRAKEHGLDAAALLANNDSYRFFDAIGDLIKTGPTGTNVADIQLILVPRSWH
jgi:glycerate 2-kinase